ncbi:MAG: helix-turn-helix domain-containing protein [Muribaculaceae bacterium]|nr:helix-turn-helix domain-containing protein [Muribaculaceae bacterium]
MRDVNNALKLTLAEMPTNVVNADTISCYRNHLTIAELKDTACIAMTAVSRAGRQETQMVAQANCGFMTILMLSDQRASGALLLAGILWMMCSLWYMRRFKPELFVAGLSYGGIVFANDKFITAKGAPIHFTPMQHSLMEMFMTTESHSLSKQEICDRLWPKKPDASDTLYTLIKRVKPILEANSNLKIESDRGKSYILRLK